MRLSRQLLRLLRAASAASDMHLCQQSATAISTVAAHSTPTIIQPSIDYALWARQQQAWRCYAAAPAREVQDSMQEVAERKLAEAHSRYQEVQATISGL